ncbi:MAG: DUF3419 family protein [Candidatus Riflebacteria bacterium]|nr:DUF3419 family protein [Candidatus Riflebacteria bacterium]
MKKPAIVYSNVWEDPELNRLSLQVKPGESVLSVTSGGCNSLCLLLENPGRVVSMDFNPAQCALLEFKKAAISTFDYDDFLGVLGVEFLGKPSKYSPEKRISLFHKFRDKLPSDARAFWDENEEIIGKGVFMSGKVEKFFAFYRWILQKMYDPSKIENLFHQPDIKSQWRAYSDLNKKRWRFLNRVLLNRFVLSLVKGAHSFAQVEDPDLSENLNRKLDKAMKNLYNPDNFFMSLMLLGVHYKPESMSPYLLEKNYPLLKKNIDRLESIYGILTHVVERYGKASFDKLNLSNIFEWMDNETFNNVIREAIAISKPKARFAYRYTLARPRQLDAANLEIMQSEPELAQRLFDQDRAFIYESFHVFQLKK